MAISLPDPSSHGLWFESPARSWTEALPLGSGLMGAMVFGGVAEERIQINDTTGWSGGPATELSGRVPSAEVAQAGIARSREAVARGDWIEADEALRAVQHGYPQSFLPFTDLIVRFSTAGRPRGEAREYRRSLDLSTATHTVTSVADDVTVRMVVRLSHVRKVLLAVIDVEGPEGVDVELELVCPLLVRERRAASDGQDVLVRLPDDVAPDKLVTDEPVRYGDGEQTALDGAVSLRWTHDGHGDGLSAARVRHAEIVLSTETNFVAPGAALSGDAETALTRARGRVTEAVAAGAEVVAAEQEADHGLLYARSALETGAAPDAGVPTDRRLVAAYSSPASVASDPGLVGLLFNFGRYLLICSSREGGLPANLQGIWNDKMQPPWSSDYTTNINLEMNYWLAEQTDLPECLPPLFEFTKALAISGTETASRVFGAPGWVAFHCSDAWGYTQSVGDGTHDPSWAFSPFTGPWLLQHVRERIRFGGDVELARSMWPVIRSAGEFHLHLLVEEPDGTLGTSPSTSPENHFTAPDGRRGATAGSSTMDVTLTRDLFRLVGEVAQLIGVAGDDPVVRAATAAARRLPDPQIGADGMIREWTDDTLRADPDHRHTAHLYFVHPGDGPTTPELAEAAQRSLEGRGDESTGWSLVWKMAMQARLGRPDRVSSLLRLLFRDATVYRGPYVGGIYPNLFTAHPPFQIDANFGFVAAIAEGLLQSHAGVVEIMKGVPEELPSGTVTGLVARPGIVVDLEWAHGELVSATLRARAHGAGTHLVRYAGRLIEVELAADTPVRLDAAAFAVPVPAL
ncbi:glycoside hydrolase family 95 protein [Compostimonas suwonensis]|uniref:Alpha-L-fucosidase 2 n=1 Tax=Compostimonas suwonensis TaxID=1048394 RepID=A0A2M9C532_9MICO|nr:glycoside hydrolase family 95 protein [Compostimonas suwonensis]PJJ65626.1 alpha-L-fucosidase 2 [Compostimonas suwonensis]